MLPVNGLTGGESIMCGKWRFVGSALVIAAAVAVLPLHAQRGQGFRGQGFGGQRGPNLGHSLELALENQETLGLSQEQVAQLQELNGVMDDEVAGLVEELRGVEESFRAGDLDRDQASRQIQALRGELLTASAPLRGRIQEVLTVEQHNKLQPLARQARPGIGRSGTIQDRRTPAARGSGMGQGGARQGQLRGSRGGVGLRSGINGQGRAPAPGFRQALPRGQVQRMGRPAPFPRRGPGWGAPATLAGGGNLP